MSRIIGWKTIDLIVTDRGPYYKTRIVDLSFAAASKIGMVDAGIVRVEIIRI
jgi:rare lipoprotein A